jgi:hypothetical protein
MDQMQDAAMGLDGPGGSVILTERNKAALKVLDETIKAGKKKIALFYGAAHMPDLSKRVREMGFKPSGPVEWKAAWDLHIRADQPSAVEKLLNDFIDALDDARGPRQPGRRVLICRIPLGRGSHPAQVAQLADAGCKNAMEAIEFAHAGRAICSHADCVDYLGRLNCSTRRGRNLHAL